MALLRAAGERLFAFGNGHNLLNAFAAFSGGQAYGLGRGPVFSPDAPSMRFDNLLGDIQAETGVLAKAPGRSV